MYPFEAPDRDLMVNSCAFAHGASEQRGVSNEIVGACKPESLTLTARKLH
jgi:hypothetical protein